MRKFGLKDGPQKGALEDIPRFPFQGDRNKTWSSHTQVLVQKQQAVD